MSNRRYNSQTRKNFFGGGSSNKKLEQLKKMLAGKNKNKNKKQKQKPSMLMAAMKGKK